MPVIVTSIASIFQNLFGLLDKLGDGLNQLIISDIPAHKQHEMELRLQRFKHKCRVNHDNLQGIQIRADADFGDQGITMPGKIASMTAHELNVTK